MRLFSNPFPATFSSWKVINSLCSSIAEQSTLKLPRSRCSNSFMAIPTPRLIFACAIPAIIVILSYIWFKRKKELEDQERLDRIAKKSLQYHPQEITYQRASESEFQQLPAEESEASCKMVIEIATDKEDACLEKGREECGEYERSTETNSPPSSCGMYREVSQDVPTPPFGQTSCQGDQNGYEIQGATDSELEEVVANEASPNNSQDHQLLLLAEIVADGIKKYSLPDPYPEDNIQSVGDEVLSAGDSKDSTILECTQECEIAPRVTSPTLEPTFQEDNRVLEPIPSKKLQCSPNVEGSLDIENASLDDSLNSLDLDSIVVEHIDSDDSHNSLIVVDMPDTSLSSLSDSQQSIDVEDICNVKIASLENDFNANDASLEDSQSSLVKPIPSDVNMVFTMPLSSPSSHTMEARLLTASPAGDLTDTSTKGSPDMVSTPMEDSPDVVSTSLKNFPDTESTAPRSFTDTSATPPRSSPVLVCTPPSSSPDSTPTSPRSSPEKLSISPKSAPNMVSAPPESSPGMVSFPPENSPDKVSTLETYSDNTTTLEGSPDTVYSPPENFLDVVVPPKSSPDKLSTVEGSPDIVSNPPEDSTGMCSIPLEGSQCTMAVDVVRVCEVEVAALNASPRSRAAELGLLVSLSSSPDVSSNFTARSSDVELTPNAVSRYFDTGSDTSSSCTLTTSLTEIEGSPTKPASNLTTGGDGDPGNFCGPVSLPDVSIACSDQLEIEVIEGCAVPSPSLPADEAELQKMANCNSLSAYGSSSHSPSDELIESPVTSNYSDLHSEGSSDSGKGGSDILTPNVEGSSSNLLPYTALQVYEFEIPQGLCGRLIGVRGRYVNLIKSKSRANISIKRHPYNPDLKICAVIGAEEDINLALGLIRKRFPVSKFPVINLLQVNTPLISGIPILETLQLHLPDSVTCDVILSSLISASHFFVQQPTHPTYPSLSRLDQFMLQCYQNGLVAPELPAPVEAGIICAASTMGGWYRAQIVYVYPDSNDCEVKFVDYGGYLRESISSLRQIRSDFMSLPFQASECYLANVTPIDEEQGWSSDAMKCFEELAQGQILQAQIVMYTEDGIPLVHLFRIQGVTTTFINRQLVTSGHANWVDTQE